MLKKTLKDRKRYYENDNTIEDLQTECDTHKTPTIVYTELEKQTKIHLETNKQKTQNSQSTSKQKESYRWYPST